MGQDISKILQRQLLLMGYKPKDTLSENIERITNKTLLNEQGAADRYSDYLNSEEGIRQHDIEMEKKIASTYPNYCWNNGEGTIVPGENKFGLSGVDAIPTGESGETKFCAYRGVGNKLLFLPVDVSKINFWGDSFETANDLLSDKLSGKGRDPIDPTDDSLQKIFVNYVLENLIEGSVSSFVTASGSKYSSYSQRKLPSSINPTANYVFYGYCTDDGKTCYENPKWVDPRNEYQKFVDDWGVWIQIGAAVATALLGLATGGASWILTTEIILELGLGVWVAQREFERGDNIAATASVIFGLLPMLKLTKWFPGVSDEVFKSLSKKFAESGLESTNDVAEYIVFYNTKLNEEEKMLLSKLLKQDEVNRNKMFKEIGEELGKLSSGKIDDGLKAMIKADPKILKDISFLKRLWVRELGANGLVVAGSMVSELVKGKEWNDSTKQKVQKIYSVIPQNTKDLFANNVIVSGEEFVNSLDVEIVTSNIDDKTDYNKMSGYIKDKMDKVATENNIEYVTTVETSTDSSDDADISEFVEQINSSQADSLRSEGWLPIGEFNPSEDTGNTISEGKKVKLNNEETKLWVKIK